MQLVQKPEEYDVLVMANLYGDIVSDLVAGMIGGLGVAPSGNIGTEAAVFEPIHGSAPSHAGKNEANPTAMILSGAMMLRHLGEQRAAERVEQAIAAVIAEGQKVTYDLRADRDPAKAATTTEMTQAIVDRFWMRSRGRRAEAHAAVQPIPGNLLNRDRSEPVSEFGCSGIRYRSRAAARRSNRFV